MRGEEMVKYVRAQRTKWRGHLARMKKKETKGRRLWNGMPQELDPQDVQKIDAETTC